MKYNDIHKELIKWKNENIISEQQYETLEKRYKLGADSHPRFYQKFKLQKTLIFLSVAIVILGIISLFSINVPVLNALSVFTLLILLITGFLLTGDYLAGRKMKVLRYAGKGIMILSGILISFLIFYTDIKVRKITGTNLLGNDWAAFVLVSTIVLLFVTYKVKEKALLGYSLFLLVLWFICEGKIHTGEYFESWLYMSFPIRIFLVSLIIMGFGYIHRNKVSYLKRFDPSEKYILFSRTYYAFGLILMFVSVWMSSMGIWLGNSLLPVKVEVLGFVILGMLLAAYAIYIGIIKNSRLFLYGGIMFFMFEVYGKFYQAMWLRIGKPLFYIITLLIFFGMAVFLEYVTHHKDQLKNELLEKNRG